VGQCTTWWSPCRI